MVVQQTKVPTGSEMPFNGMTKHCLTGMIFEVMDYYFYTTPRSRLFYNTKPSRNKMLGAPL